MLPPTQPPGSEAQYPLTTLPNPPSSPLEMNRAPAPGELQIREQRSWKTWQLLVAAFLAALGGMLIDYWLQPASTTASASGGSGAYKLPPPPGSSATTTTVDSGASGGDTTTTTADYSTTTTVASSSTPTTAGAASQTTATAQVLLTSPQSHGNWTSPAFSITSSSWDIGWAFQCTTAPASGSSFEVFVAPSGGSPSETPAVSESGLTGQSVSSQSTTGQQMLVVEAPANCIWIVKVTGS